MSGTHVVRDLEREVGLERAVVDVVLCSHANGEHIYVSKLGWERHPFSRPTKLVLPSAFSREAKAAVISSRAVSSAAEASSACSWAFIGRLPSRMSSERASPQEANSAGCRVTEALEKSRTGQDRRDHVSTRVEEIWSGVLGRATGLYTLDLALDLRLDKGKNILVQARADLTVRDQHSESEDSSEECNIAPSELGPREELGSREVHLHKTFRHHTDVPHLELISVFRDRRL